MEGIMRKYVLLLGFVITVVAAILPVYAQNTAPASNDLVRVAVTVEGSKQNPNPTITADDIVVYQEKDRRPLVEWVPAKGDRAALEFAILIDDSLSVSDIGLQLNDLAAFIRSMPPSTQVAVAYGLNGNAQILQNFTADHEAAAKALRLPFGTPNISSVFFAVGDLVSRWPQSSARHEMLVVSNGIDLFYGVADSSPALSPSLQQAIDQAQRAGVTIYTIYASGFGRRAHDFFLVSNGQGCLSRLADETGGGAYFQGFQTPIAFQPYLQDITRILGEQYLLTFKAQLGKKGELQRLRLKTEQKRVDLTAPERVYIPAAQ
jgi:VWFA-related protein